MQVQNNRRESILGIVNFFLIKPLYPLGNFNPHTDGNDQKSMP